MYIFNDLKVARRVIASTAFQYGFGYGFCENPYTWLFIKLGLMNIDHFGAFITPTITLNERLGFYTDKKKPWKNIRLYPDKILNKFGWNNCGIDKFRCRLEKLAEKSNKCIVSLGALADINEITLMAENLNQYDIAAIEINISCHNVNLDFLNDKLLKKLIIETRAISRHPIIIKVAAESDCLNIAKLSQAYGINLHVMNTVRVYSSALGGVCGQSSYKNKPIALKIIREIRRAGFKNAIIGGSGIWTLKDIHNYKQARANLFSLSHQFLYLPFWPGILASRVK